MTLNTDKQAGDTIEPTEWNEAAGAANKVTDQTLVAADVSDFDTEVSNNTDVTANTTHRTSDGSDHTFINQDVTTTASPTFSTLYLNSTTAQKLTLIDNAGDNQLNFAETAAGDKFGIIHQINSDAFGIYDYDANTYRINIDSSGNTAIIGDFSVDTDTLYVDSTNDRVGIGTTSPTAPFEVNGGTENATIKITSTDIHAGIEFQDSNAITNPQLLSRGDHLTTNANLQIGSFDTPAATLDVNGDIAITDGVTAPAATTGKAKIFVDSADGDLKIIFGDGTTKTITTD